MAPARITVFLSQKRSTKNGIIRPAYLQFDSERGFGLETRERDQAEHQLQPRQLMHVEAGS